MYGDYVQRQKEGGMHAGAEKDWRLGVKKSMEAAGM